MKLLNERMKTIWVRKIHPSVRPSVRVMTLIRLLPLSFDRYLKANRSDFMM